MLPLSVIFVSSTIDSSIILQKAVALAAKLNLPFAASPDQRTTEFVLAYTSKGLQILHLPFTTQKQKTICLLFVDFVHGKNGFRLAQNCTSKQPLARAAGVKPGYRPTILDATAGCGVDGFVLASLGCRVMMCERSPILGALLEDGLERAAREPRTAEIVEQRIKLKLGDSRDYLHNTSDTFHTIYLDPMYPDHQSSALNKQTLRTIRALVGGDPDGTALLETALKKAKNRVVVKRPHKAPLLSALQPSHVIAMKNSRFDVYLTFEAAAKPTRHL